MFFPHVIRGKAHVPHHPLDRLLDLFCDGGAPVVSSAVDATSRIVHRGPKFREIVFNKFEITGFTPSPGKVSCITSSAAPGLMPGIWAIQARFFSRGLCLRRRKIF
jgi:hypothetical protein